ncbi:MAG: InlB B-repeat-containing protein [Pseudomonadota bacterium]
MRTRFVFAWIAALAVAAGVARAAPERQAVVTATVTVSVSGGGRVQSEPAGAIDCGSTCSAQVQVGATIVLRAIPDGGRELRGWEAGCTGRSLRCELVVDAATSVSANFGPTQTPAPPNTLAVTRSEGGTVVSDPEGLIDCGSTCSAGWIGGGQVTIRARASNGFRFLGWFGDCSGSDDACRVTLDQDRDAVASFVRNPIPPGNYRITIRNMNPPGSGSTTGTVEAVWNDGSESFPCGDAECTTPPIAFGTNVTLRPVSGTLKEWSGACVGRAAECHLVISGNAQVTVSFRPDGPPPSFGVNVARSGNGSVRSSPNGIDCGPSSTCAAAFGERTRVRLTATPASDKWLFAGWRGDCGGSDACVVVADTTRSVTAVFRLARRTLRVELFGRGRGTVRSTPEGIACPPDCSFGFPDGAQIALAASPEAGSVFAGWSGACSGTACSVTATGEPVARARFDRCASLDYGGFVAKVLKRPRRVRVGVVLTGASSLRIALLRGRAVVRQVRTGVLAPGTRTAVLPVPARAKPGRYTVRLTVADACGGTKARTRTVRLR